MEASSAPEQDSEVIVRACTYHRHEFDRLLVQTPDRKLQAPFLQTSFQTSAGSGLGLLEHLPDELILMILRELDIVSYLQFRGVNTRARSIATNFKDYKTVVKYGRGGLKAILKVRLGHLFTITYLYRVLVSLDCEFCGKFATFLYLITCQRCCFTCLQISSELRVLPIPAPKDFVKAVKKTAKEIERVCEPRLSVVYGKYTLETWPRVNRPKWLAQAKPAIEKLQSLDISYRIAKGVLDHVPEHQDRYEALHHYCYRYMAATAFPSYNADRDQIEHGVSCKGCQFRLEEHARVTDSSLEPPWGLNDRDRAYTKEEFMCHFRSCEHAQKVWADTLETGMAPVSKFTNDGGIVKSHERHELH
ncbi:hypothetical protein FHETE_10945 [Fusarium heterosporum]|uniref:F-box domain-containing protein n=1 Tax=Fusarium heterosporum TaxID=42747 RepID=A0A8H5WFI5_FUSHE|nr:hypothetical protein FHETE_10945 [Fusarium heterosporum]